jgi:hypothetical protein
MFYESKPKRNLDRLALCINKNYSQKEFTKSRLRRKNWSKDYDKGKP